MDGSRVSRLQDFYSAIGIQGLSLYVSFEKMRVGWRW